MDDVRSNVPASLPSIPSKKEPEKAEEAPNKPNRFLQIAPDKMELLEDIVNELNDRREVQERRMARKIAEALLDILAEQPEKLKAILLSLGIIGDKEAKPTSSPRPIPESVPELVPEPVAENPSHEIAPPEDKPAPSAAPEKEERPPQAKRGSPEYKARKKFDQKNYERRKKGLPPLPRPASWTIPGTASPENEEGSAQDVLEDG